MIQTFGGVVEAFSNRDKKFRIKRERYIGRDKLRQAPNDGGDAAGSGNG